MVTASGCTSDPSPIERFQGDVQMARAFGTVALPEELPPRLADGWVTANETTTSVSFYSENAPIVTVCGGRLEDCRKLSSDVEVRVVQVSSQEVVVSLGRREDPSPAPALNGDLDDFWTGVAFTMGKPDWLGPK